MAYRLTTVHRPSNYDDKMLLVSINSTRHFQVEFLTNDLSEFENKLDGWTANEASDLPSKTNIGDEDIDYQQRKKANIERFQRDLDRQRRIGAIDKQVPGLNDDCARRLTCLSYRSPA
jgi:hypothetical protein